MHALDGGVRVRPLHHNCGIPAQHTPRLGQPVQPQRRRWSAAVRAFDGNDGRGPATSGSSGGKGGLDPSLEMAVPAEQRPVNELSALRKSVLYSWAALPTPDLLQRLGVTWAAFFTVIGGPIAYQTFDPWEQPVEFCLSAGLGSLLVVAVAVLRIYLGWAYVGDRLLSAAVEYEETGWYDGQVFVKPPEVLARDRLLGSYEVKPVLALLKTTLVGSGAALLLSTVLLFSLIREGSDSDGVYGRGASRGPVRRDANGDIIYSAGLRSLADLRDDDKAAAEEAAAQNGRPGYCGNACDGVPVDVADSEPLFCEPCGRISFRGHLYVGTE